MESATAEWNRFWLYVIKTKMTYTASCDYIPAYLLLGWI